MDYSQKMWATGDTITVAALNNVEQGLAEVAAAIAKRGEDMKYTRKTWATGDTITADALNNIEQGIADAADVITALEDSGSMDDTVISFNQMNDTVTSYLAAADTAYTDDNYASVSVASDYAGAQSDDPVGYDLEITSAGTIYFQDETDGQFSWSDSTTAGTYTVYDLVPEHVYRWYVVDADGATTQNGKIQATGFLRMIYGADTIGADNCRDMGGWPCDSGTIKYGILYRGADPVFLTAATKTRLKERLRIKCQIDMYASSGTAKLWSDILYDEFPLSDANISDDYEIGGAYYDTFVACLKQIMDNAVKGVGTYYHCYMGADRTGLVAWALYILLGVSEANADKDYELTNLAGNTGRYRGTSSYGSRVDYFADMGGSLFDGIIYWCARAGISAALINNFRAAMIDGSPATVAYNNLITTTLTLCSLDNTATEVANGGSYSATLTVDDGAVFEGISVYMDGADVTDEVWDVDAMTITIDNITGDIVITATANANLATVIYSLTNCSANSAPASVTKGNSLTITLTADTYYSLPDTATVTMGGTAVSAYADGVVSIAEVTGDIVITVTATCNFVNQIPISTDGDGSVYNDCGYAAVKLSSSGTYGVTADSTTKTTGFIPCGADDTLQMVLGTTSTSAITVGFFDSSKTYLWRSSLDNTSFTKCVSSSGEIVTFTLDQDASGATSAVLSYFQNSTYVRVQCATMDDDSIITVNEEIA